MKRNKKAVSALVATVLLILITFAAVGIIWGAIMPMLNRATQLGQACMNARLSIDTTQGYTCYDAEKKQANIMVARGAEDFELVGMQIGLASAGYVKSYEIRPGSSSIDSYTKLLLHMDGTNGSQTFTDSSMYGKSVTANEQAYTDTRQNKFGGSSAFFDGSLDSLTLADSDDWDFGTGDFTIDFWYKHNAVVSTYPAIAEHGAGWVIVNYNAHQALHGIAFSGAGFFLRTYDGPYDGLWHHIAFTRSGTTGRSFLDGVQIQTAESSAATGASTSLLYIGRWQTNYQTTTNGWLDEFRISKGIARWTENFTVPSFAYMPSEVDELPLQNEARTYKIAADDIKEATVAPIVKIGTREKICDVTSKVQVAVCA